MLAKKNQNRPKRHRLILLPLCALLSLCIALPACAQISTWTGAAADGGNWNNAGNWNPLAVPNSPTAAANFTSAGIGNVVINSSIQAQSLAFTNPTGSFTLTSISGQTLSQITGITVGSAITSTQTINLSSVSTGSLLVPGSGVGALTITNSAFVTPAITPTLLIGPSTIIGRVGTGSPGLTFSGTGTTRVSGNIGAGILAGILKTGPGSLTISGDNSAASGGATLGGGSLALDYSSSASARLPAGALNLNGGDLSLKANATTAFTENVLPAVLNPGQTSVVLSANGGAAGINLNLNFLNRTAGGTIDITTDTNSNVLLSNSTVNGILGGWATANGGTSWASKSGSNIVPLASYAANTYSSGTNTDVTNPQFVPPAAAFTTNSLRFNTPAPALLVSGANVLQSGAILVTPSVFAAAIGPVDFLSTNTSLTTPGGAGEFFFSVYSSGAGNGAGLEIDVRLIGSAGLTKTGPGTLTLGGNNFVTLTGPININRGDLRLTSSGAVNPASPISFKDNRTGVGQSFIVRLLDDQSFSFPNPITFSAPRGAILYPNTLSTDQSENSRVTLSGVISSAPGTITPIHIDGLFKDTSGFNLTGANTFTGDVLLSAGTLGINSNASLGNPVNALTLAVNSSTAGGLEFLNGGIDLARSVAITAATQVITNGADTNTISGVISGGGSLSKLGTGTLILSGANLFSSQINLRAGTLRIATGNNLGPTAESLYLHGGTVLAVTETTTIFRTPILGTFASPAETATLDIATGKTVTLAAQIFDVGFGATGALQKTGGGTLILNGLSSNYSGGTIVHQGALRVAGDSALGAAAAPVTVGPLGSLIYTGNSTTARSFGLSGGTLAATTGNTLTFANAAVAGGFLSGSFASQPGTANTFTGLTTFTSASINQAGADSFTNIISGGQFTSAPGASATLTRFTSTSSGRITIGGSVIVSEFTSDGQLTIPSGGTVNNSFAPIFLGGGSTTLIASGGALFLNGQNLELRGALLVNNGSISIGTTNINYGSLAKGSGVYGAVNVTDGGKFSPGNSPGSATTGSTTWNSGGSYLVEIADALSDSARDFWSIRGQLNLAALSAHPFTISLESTDGLIFDPTHDYTWPILHASDGIASLDPSAIALDASAFKSDLSGGRFSLESTPTDLIIHFSAVPEPISVALFASISIFAVHRRRFRR